MAQKYIPKHLRHNYTPPKPIYETKKIDWTKYHYVKVDSRTWVLKLKE